MMNPTVKIILGLLGGLAIFIYGMNIMSESLQKVAGDKMKKILGILTKNPIMGVLAGALVTAVLQSSSATTAVLQNIRCIQTTAKSHSRIFIVEIMWHKTGWLTLHSGIASGADVILMPEIPYDIKKIKSKIEGNANKKNYTVIAVAEGAYSCELANLSKKERKAKIEGDEFPSVGFRLAAELQNYFLENEIRVQIIGHSQRGGEPCPFDKIFASRLGAAAASLILEKKFGFMVGLSNGNIIPVPLNEVAGKLKTVSENEQLVQHAENMGICMGR